MTGSGGLRRQKRSGSVQPRPFRLRLAPRPTCTGRRRPMSSNGKALAPSSNRSPAAPPKQPARRYPLTYYGQRARSRLRWPAPARISPPGDGSLPDDRFSSTHEELGALGLDREAADEAEALLPSRAGPQALRFIAVAP